MIDLYIIFKLPQLGEENSSCLAQTLMEEEGGKCPLNRESESSKLSVKIAVMEPILRFLQLLCENHNSKLQVCVLFLLPNIG